MNCSLWTEYLQCIGHLKVTQSILACKQVGRQNAISALKCLDLYILNPNVKIESCGQVFQDGVLTQSILSCRKRKIERCPLSFCVSKSRSFCSPCVWPVLIERFAACSRCFGLKVMPSTTLVRKEHGLKKQQYRTERVLQDNKSKSQQDKRTTKSHFGNDNWRFQERLG